MKIEMSGLEELKSKIEKLQRSIDRIKGTHEIPLKELLTPEFMRENTPYDSLEVMLAAGGFTIKSGDDIQKSQPKLDAFVAQTTKFPNWKSMLSESAKKWATQQLDI